jgi:nucleotide-binding universal stress UspA family protein
MGFKRILVTVDRSDRSEPVFWEAVDLAKANDALLQVFHCLTYHDLAEVTASMYADVGPYPDLMARAYQDQQARIAEQRQHVEDLLTRYRDLAQDRGLEIGTDYAIGEAGHCICNAAQAWSADAVVMGRRGRTGLAEAFLGSVSNYVLHHVNCCVLVIQ